MSQDSGAEAHRLLDTAQIEAEPLGHIRSRLALASLLYALGYTIDQVADRVALLFPSEALPSPDFIDVGFIASSLSIIISLAVFWLTRNRKIPEETLVNVALFYEVAASFGIAISEHWDPWPAGYAVRGISWIAFFIIVFPLIVPTPPGRAILATFCSAATGPFALLLTVALRGNPMPEQRMIIYLFVPNFMAFGLGSLIILVLDRLRREFRKARRLGSYRLVRLIGQGGMGQVWEAEHLMLARSAAVKLIRRDAAGGNREEAERMLTRFRREAAATARLRSPHTIDVYDYGRTPEGEFYYVMDRLAGFDMQRLVDNFGPVQPARAAYLVRQVCRSLAEAHDAGLIHRDIKPSNIHVCRLGTEHDFVKVLDFGLVKLNSDAPPASPTWETQNQNRVGTPAFMPPEMALGLKEVDARSDIYALGCVLYWLVTGRCVFEGKSTLEILFQHVQTSPQAPSTLSLHRLPDPFERLVLACLEKNPVDRPQSAREVDTILAGCTFDEPWDETRAGEWWESHLEEIEHTASVSSPATWATTVGLPAFAAPGVEQKG